MSQVGRNIVVAIVISEYEDTHYPGRRAAIEDIEELLLTLQTYYQFEEDDIHRLYDESATEEAITVLFADGLTKMTPQDNLFIIYDGYSLERKKLNESYLVPYDSEKDRIGSYISNTELSILFKELKVRNVLVLADAYFSPTFHQQLRSLLLDSEINSRTIIASGSRRENADDKEGSSFLQATKEFFLLNRDDSPDTLLLSTFLYNQYGDKNSDFFRFYLNDTHWTIRRKYEEDIIWGKTLEEDSRESYAAYLEKYPSGRYNSEAYRNLADLIAERAWQETVQKDKINDYELFSTIYPHSGFVHLASARIDKLMERAQKNVRGAVAQSNEIVKAVPPVPAKAKTVESNEQLEGIRSNPRLKIKVQQRDGKENSRTRIQIRRRPLIAEPEPLSDNPIPQIKMNSGKILCQIPTVVTVGKCYEAEVRISLKQLNNKALKAGLTVSEDVKTEVDGIQVARVMQVELKEREGNNNLEIVALTQARQLIDNTYTFWKFDVYPKRIGLHTVIVAVTAIIVDADYGEESKEILAWKKEIDVKSKIGFDKSGGQQLLASLKSENIYFDKEKLKNLVIEDETAEAIEQLERLFENIDIELYNQLLLIKKDYHKTKQKALSGLKTEEETDTRLRKIDNVLLALIDDISLQEELLEIRGLDNKGLHPAMSDL